MHSHKYHNVLSSRHNHHDKVITADKYSLCRVKVISLFINFKNICETNASYNRKWCKKHKNIFTEMSNGSTKMYIDGMSIISNYPLETDDVIYFALLMKCMDISTENYFAPKWNTQHKFPCRINENYKMAIQ